MPRGWKQPAEYIHATAVVAEAQKIVTQPEPMARSQCRMRKAVAAYCGEFAEEWDRRRALGGAGRELIDRVRRTANRAGLAASSQIAEFVVVEANNTRHSASCSQPRHAGSPATRNRYNITRAAGIRAQDGGLATARWASWPPWPDPREPMSFGAPNY